MAVTDTAAPQAAPMASGQWLTGYWHNFNNGSTTMRLSQVPTAYNLIAVAFADSTAQAGGITFNLASSELGGYTVAQFKADIAAIKAQGRKVIISVGGQNGNVLVQNAQAASNFATSTYALMQTYGFNGVDIDLENGVNAQYMSAALHQLRTLAGASLIITMAPQTIDYQATTMPYYQLTKNISDILTIVNMQYYNSGAMMGCDNQIYSQGTVDFLTALSCIELNMGLRPGQVGIGVPAVPAAAGGGYQPMANVVKALDCLEKGTNCGRFVPAKPYGPIGGAMTWSINWDATNNYEFARVVGNRLNVGGTPTTPPTTKPPTTPPTTTPPTTKPPTTPPGTCLAAWSSTKVYTGGDRASYNGRNYEAKWWTLGENPAQSGSAGVWKDLGACGTTPPTTKPPTTPPTTKPPTTPPTTKPPTTPPTTTPPTTKPPTTPPSNCTAPAWVNGKVYVAGDKVTYQGKAYTAQWWTNSDVPGAAQWGPWGTGATC